MVNIFSVERSSQESRGFSHERFKEKIRDGLHETGKDFPYRDEVIPVAKEALNIAIKALEQQPVTLQMQTVIEFLINLIQKYGVRPSIEFEREPGAMWIRIKFSKNKKCITKTFYYVPVGEGTIENFRLYNPGFEFEILEMIDELRKATKEDE